MRKSSIWILVVFTIYSFPIRILSHYLTYVIPVLDVNFHFPITVKNYFLLYMLSNDTESQQTRNAIMVLINCHGIKDVPPPPIVPLSQHISRHIFDQPHM